MADVCSGLRIIGEVQIQHKALFERKKQVKSSRLAWQLRIASAGIVAQFRVVIYHRGDTMTAACSIPALLCQWSHLDESCLMLEML